MTDCFARAALGHSAAPPTSASRQPRLAAGVRDWLAIERDERLVAWLIFSRRFLGDFLEAWPRFSPWRPSIVNSPAAKRKMLVGRPATTQAIDHGSERRARPQ